MLRDLLSSRWFQGGFAFFVLCVGGSLLYSWHVQRTTAAEMERHDQFTQGLEKPSEPRRAAVVNVENSNETTAIVETPTEQDSNIAMDTEPVLPSDSELLDAMDAFLSGDVATEETPAEEVPVSPYGFGPYPEVPAGLPMNMFPAPSANHELMRRVRIKLISQGINVVGTTMEDGLVYPVIKGTAYVRWKSYWRPTGKVTYISRFKGHPEDGARLDAIRFEKGKSLTKADVPPDIKLISFEDGAIDPYQFLHLP